MDFVRSDWDGWLDEHGGDDRLTFTASEIKAFLAEIDRLRAELDRLRGAVGRDNQQRSEDFYQQMEQAQDAAHVIIECGIGHKDIDACGCEQCERVRKGMVEAGYLKPPDTGGRE